MAICVNPPKIIQILIKFWGIDANVLLCVAKKHTKCGYSGGLSFDHMAICVNPPIFYIVA
jgi:hypothetical protein